MQVHFCCNKPLLSEILFLILASPLSRQYMVLLPFLINTDAPEKVCVQLTHLNESVTLSATLEYQGENRSLIDDVVSEKDIFTCIPFSLPKSNSTSVAFLTVMVKGETQQFRSRKSVLVKNSESLVFVQTDKPIYKPGQTVLFRIVSLDKDFHPLNEKSYSHLQDPQRNRIYQWQGVELEIGLIELSFPLTSDPMQGSYKIVVQKSVTSHVEHSFSVEEYVLPKYEVLVKLPKMITIEDKEIPVSVCGLYTYGKPVPGLVNVQVCRKFSHSGSHCYGKDSEAVCEEFVRQVNARGCVSDVVRTKIFQLQRSGYKMNIEVQGKITEDGTGIEMVGTGSCEITSIMSKVSFHLLDSYYRPGIPLFGMVKLVDGIDAPIANETIRISVNEGNYEGNYTTDEQGQSWFSIDTTTFTEASLEIRVSGRDRAEHKPELNCYDSDWITPSYEHALHSISRFYSPSNSFLKIEPKHETLSCGFPTEVRVHYVFTPDVIGEQKKIVIYYLVMAKGSIMLADTHDLTVNPGDVYGIFRLTFPVEATIAPKARMLVYTTLPSGEVIASSADFQVESCLPNKVSNLSFIPKEGLPASNTRLQLHSSPKSLCATRAVDKSVLLMKPEDELSHRSLYDLLPEEMKEIQGYSFKDYYLEDDNVNPCLSLDNILLNGFVYVPISPDGKGDAYDILKVSTSLSFLLVTPFWNTVSSPPLPCPEGNAELDVTIPDTITEWKANAFCTSSDTGFGLSPTVSLRAFQPFFVELTLPYSVVRGEAFTLKATIFNYLTACIRVSVSLAKSTHFLAAPVEKEEESYCICLNERKTVAWAVTPKSLGQVEFSVSAEALQNQQPCGNAIVETPEKGRKDTVIRQLLVEVWGMLKKSMSETVALVLPENVVDGSARAYFSVLGDIMGTSMQNLHQLLQMPFGCGEQNMVLFAPNIYVLDYLNKTGQLSEEIKSKAIGYLVSGYQRQLNYKHWDGSYSTFGPQFGQAGNTWLTAFVLKSFAQARPYIFIYEKHIQDALIWLTQKQKENGCFHSSGTLLNNAMKGGVDNEVSLTAYITIALLEIPLPVTHSVVRNALFCLETAANAEENHVYTKALLAYAFALAGKEEKRKAMLGLLEKEAVKKDGSVHWQRPGKEMVADLPYYHYRAPSAEVEMTAYVLLAHLTTQLAPSQEELSFASLIAKWISGQQNPNGGFSSTQVISSLSKSKEQNMKHKPVCQSPCLSCMDDSPIPALSRFSLCACTQISPHLPTSHRLPQCGERPQGFPLPLSQACSPTHTPRAQSTRALVEEHGGRESISGM
uniref:Alpha-2-macroglobulin n=1 Tax=Anas zonorhyncha TaxID=75864 RepID=A0A8B9UQ06_9AVES